MMKYILFLLLSITPLISLHAQGNDSLSLPSSSLKPARQPSKFQQKMDAIELARLDSLARKTGISTSVLQRDQRLHEVDVDYYTFVYAQQKKIFTWQLFSAKIILVVVIIVVFMGLFLSYLQFRTYEKIIDQKSERLAKGTITATTVEVPANSNTAGEETITATSMELSKDGMKINSAVIGLIILTMSIAFFFLYLRFVFGINTESMK